MRRNGFTLIELMLAVLIIGIVAAIAVSRVGDLRVRAAVAAVQSDLHNLHIAQEMYYQTHNLKYADEADDLTRARLFRPTRGVTVEISVVEPSSWKATAEHVSTGSTCEFDSLSSLTECSYQSRSGRRIGGSTTQTLVMDPAGAAEPQL